MPKTKKLSYAKRKARNAAAKRLLQMKRNDGSLTTADEMIETNTQLTVEITDNDEEINIQDIIRRNREEIRSIILDVKKELNDACINAFFKVMTINTSFKPQDTIFYQAVQFYQRVNTDKDIQILYGGEIGLHAVGHWTCVYYDGSVVHVYDTLHRKLSPFQKEILNHLYAKYSVVYENIQIQPDGVSCGVFACAIATTLANGGDPTVEQYCVDDHGHWKSTLTLRNHLVEILERETLVSFPTIAMRQKSCIPQQGKNAAASTAEKSQPKRTYASVCRTTPQGTIDQQLSGTSEAKRETTRKWWAAHKDEINKKRRTDYLVKRTVQCDNVGVKYVARPYVKTVQVKDKSHVNKSDDEKAQKRAKYASNADANKYRKRAKYAADPNVKKMQEKAKHDANPQIRKTRNGTRYANNPEVKKTRERVKYAADPEVKRTRERVKYAANPETKKAYEKEKYQANSEKKKNCERKKYATDSEGKIASNRKNYLARANKKADQRKLAQTQKIIKKYKCMSKQENTIMLLGSVERYIDNMASKISHNKLNKPQSRIEAERIIKWCIQARKSLVRNVHKTLTNLKNRVEVCSIQAAESSDIESKLAAFCGESKHTGSTKAYHIDTAYHELNIIEDPLIMSATGQNVNVLPTSAGTHLRESWICSQLCVKSNLHTIKRLEHLLTAISSWKLRNIRNRLERVNVCSVNKSGLRLGHSPGCYADPIICKSLLLPLQILQPHFPQMRYFTRQIYELMKLIAKINRIDNALMRGDWKFLKSVSTVAAQKVSSYQACSEGICLNEDQIVANHPHAFRKLAKRSMDVPQSSCVTCEKLCYRRDVSDLEKLKKPLSGKYWVELQQHIDDSAHGSDFICHYCLDKFRHNQMPPTCILNRMTVNDVPSVISSLNDYEKILIQRAKAFQTVQRMGTVSKKHLPHKFRIQKVKGRTFHLPLPLEETLKKLPSPTDALNPHQELFVMVCGIPNKSKVVWSNLVDVKKVYEALVWLKRNNQLYAAIELPAEPEMLLEALTQDVEIRIEPEQSNLDESTDLLREMDRDEEIGRRAMLTQIVDTDEYYEQHTIYPINAERENETATALYQMLKVQEKPLNTWDKCLDLMCFPDLYPYGKNGQREDRTVSLREYDFIRCRLMSKHSAFRLNQQYLFFLLHDSNIRQLKSGIFHKLNVIKPKEKLHAEMYLELISKEQLEGNLTTIFARLRNTDQYWRKPRNELGCMAQNYGPATWFLTLSPSEWMWDDLAEYIRRVNGPKMAHMSISELVAADPVSTSRYLDNKFHAMLKFICSTDNPIGEITHYFWRREYQGRGTQHFHLLIWIKDAPTIGELSNDEVIKFITKYVTCRLPNKDVSPTLYRRVDTHQRHTHNDYCLRNKKNKTGFSKVCKFGFPRPVTEAMVIRDVAVAIAGRKQLKSKSRLYDLPRSDKEICINDYNPIILTAWEGNMDIQFIGEKSTVLNWYCTRYSTKTESSTSAEIFENINSTKSLSSQLWSVTTRCLNNRACGALEAADTLLGIPLYGTDPDTTIRWLDVNQVRSRKVRPHSVVEQLDPNSTDIFYPSLIDDYYPNRPEELESLHLYDFPKWYEVSKNKPVNSDVEIYEIGYDLYLKRRQRGYLINHYKYNVDVEPEKYFYALLLLFKPWRDTDELKSDRDSNAEAFEACKTELIEALRYHERLSDIQKGFDHVKELIEKNMDELVHQMSRLSSQESLENKFNPLGFQPVEADLAMREFNDVDGQVDEVDVDKMISELNDDQKRIFDQVTAILNTNNDTLRLFVSGAGGTGKSFLIKTIRSWTKQTLGKTTAVTAPTGLAAFNNDGLTVHRLFQLPIEHGGTPKYKELSDQVLKILRADLKDVVLFIIDEVSVISNITLTYIHLRLFEIFGTLNSAEGWFGGEHIMVLGDLLQLPPVNEDSAFRDLSKNKVEKYLGSVGTVNLWSNLFSYDELLINVRQQNDSKFLEILNRVRFGVLTSEDQRVLESRKIELMGESVNDKLENLCSYIQKLPVDTVCLFSTGKQCEVLNTAMLAKIPGDEIELKAEDTVDCIPYSKKRISKVLNRENEDDSRTAGLAKTIVIKIGAKIMIRRNIDVSLGLINGTIGHVISVSHALDTGEVESLKIALASGAEHTIVRVSTKFEIMNGAFIFRNQFPVSLSYGITIHKSQGLTLNSVVMDIGNTLFTSGQAYVALSRIRSLEGLHLINLDPYSFKVQEAALVEYNRLRRLYRPELAEISMSHVRNTKVKDTVWSIPLYLENIQSDNNFATLRDSMPNVIGLKNIDGMSCYANASLQAIFQCRSIIHELTKLTNNDSLESLAYSYVTGGTELNSLAVRKFAGKQFTEKTQQDAAEFIMALCEQSDILRKAVQHELITTTRCNNCGLRSDNTQPNHILALPVRFALDMKCTKNLQDLIDHSFSRWSRMDGECENCHENNKLQKTVVTSVKEIVMVQFMLFSYEDARASKIRHFKVDAVPTTKVTIDNTIFKVHGTIFHHGEDLHSGHYSTVLKDKMNDWLGVSDMNVRKMIWPRGATDAYILILQKIT